MCNSGVEGFPLPEKIICSGAAVVGTMDSPAAPSPSSGDERGPRAKFLCSFGGSILPRPLDGKLRYVGGETRIVTVPHLVSYDDFAARMREIFEGTAVIKYQQPEEDLDALVSVVNDDDVRNMMEEYEKLLSTGEGFTRLRIFLFSQLSDADAGITAAHFDADDRETERRYVDALNSLTDAVSHSPPLDFADQFLSHGPLHFNTPHLFHGQIYGELDASWNPSYFSPRLHAVHDIREYPGSPSSVRYHHFGIGEFADHKPKPVEHQPNPAMENMGWLPPGAIIQEKSGFPIHLDYHHQCAYEGNPTWEHRHVAFKRGQNPMANSWFPDTRLKQGHQHFDQFNACTECYHGSREPYILNQDRRVDHGMVMADFQRHDGSRFLHSHHNDLRLDDPRIHLPQPGRVGEHYIVDVNDVNHFYGHANFYEGNELFEAPQTDSNPHLHVDNFEESGDRHDNHPPVCAEDSFNQFQHKLHPLHLRREARVSLHPGASFESSGLMTSNGAMSSGPVHDYQDRSSKLSCHDMEAKSSVSTSHIECVLSDINNAFTTKINSEIDAPIMPNGNPLFPSYESVIDETAKILEKNRFFSKLAKEDCETNKAVSDIIVTLENDDNRVSSLDTIVVMNAENDEEHPSDQLEQVSIHLEGEAEFDGGGEKKSFSRIEPTAAEAVALAEGLQTIQNDDLEEIKELGSGTFGAVYHSKWRGSDVAVKRIKASCFAGKPSERKRLIADFWKEALTLSSLHHPNVVSFYGVVRDGPDGSLATVTEFMINGSLKQFIQKKDRTIDRRKRLIIAMDVAFGMEYLHGKNIVHFDLKCENLLVNMRDPHRPICKIGDLGLSKMKQHTLVSGGIRGTLPWMAPELLSGKSTMVSDKIDVYSFGIVMWELLTGEEPYSDRHCASIIGGIVNSTLRPKIPSWCDPEWKSLMESCWSSDPAQRPSFSEISHKLRKMAAAANVK